MNKAQSPLQCIVYNQYTDTNVARLVQGICSISKGYGTVGRRLLNEYYDINIATAERLDNFGKLLNFNRYITFLDPLDILTPKSPGIDEYKVIIEPDFKKCRLQDDSYRKVLKVLFQPRNTVASVRTLSKVISDAVDADVFVHDKLDMQYITYYFLDRIPGFLEICIKNFDILPRPAGMATQYISAISRFLGFLIQSPHTDRESTAKIVSSFWKTRFPETTDGISLLPDYTAAARRLPPYQLTTITEEDWKAWELGWREAAENDANLDRITNELEKYAASQQTKDLRALIHWRQYLNAPGFQPYTDAIKMTATKDYNTKEFAKAMQKVHKEAVLAAERTRALQRYQYRMSQISKHPHNYDPRRDLIYDPKSCWYYYKKEQDGKFLPEFISTIYQDPCGVWYSQTNFVSQMVSGNDLELRSSYYGDDHHLKTLPIDTASPLIQRYRPLFLKILHAPEDHDKGVTEPQAAIMGVIRNIFDLMHDCVKRWQKAARINESSFRACLDFEYRACSLIQYANAMRSKDIYYNNDYYRLIYDSIVKYYGYCNDYYSFWKDYDTDSPAYKRRQYLRTQRYLVYSTRRWLQDQYSTMSRYIDNLKNMISSGLRSTLRTELENLQYLLSSITILKKDLETEFYNEIETGTFKGGLAQIETYYKQTTLKNDALSGDRDWNVKMVAMYDKIIGAYGEAASSCEILERKCKNNESVTGSGWLSTRCMMYPDIEYEPNASNCTGYDCSVESNHRHGGWYCWNNAYNARNQTAKHRSEADKARRKREVFKLKIKTVDQEYQTRTLVTKERTLQDVMRYYNEYSPRVWPPPELSQEEVDAMYPDWAVPPFPAPQGVLSLPLPTDS